jgi:hypothetical protein
MPTGGKSKSDCGESSYSISQDIKITCRHSKVKAPRGVKEADGGQNLDDAIKQYCNDNNGKTVKKGDNIYQRYSIAEWGILNRSSFWLRSAITCGEEAKINKNDCVKALTQGMEKCAQEDDKAEEGFTRGHAASFGCMDYSIDLNGKLDDKSPPWAEAPAHFPPPGDTGYKPICIDYYGPNQLGKNIAQKDLYDAIDSFCVEGAEVKGLGKTLDGYKDYPPKGQPPFWPKDSMKLQLSFGAVFNAKGANSNNDRANWHPYNEGAWCEGYDWKIHRDDCAFAFRRIYDKCSRKDQEYGLSGGEFTYRCVRYISHIVNTR